MTFERLRELDEELAEELVSRKIAAVAWADTNEEPEIRSAFLVEYNVPLDAATLERLRNHGLCDPGLWLEFISYDHGDDEERCLEIVRDALV